MPKILCTTHGAPTEIGGLKGLVKFVETADGLVSEDVDQEVADHFLSIPGYQIAKEGSQPASKTAAKTGPSEADLAAEAAERDELIKRAAAANMDVDSRWKLPRLRSEVERAEAAVKAAAGAPADAAGGAVDGEQK